MSTAAPGSIISGVYWHDQTPALATADPDGSEHEHPLALGHPFGLSLDGDRRCVGLWISQLRRRQHCPFTQPVASGAVNAHCQACAAADHGHALARGAITDDGRRYALYLAWFGPGMPKVGLSALERGADRLAEQGALAYTLLARGALPAVRALEKAVSASGMAPERRRRHAKIAAWRRLSNPGHRHQEVTQLYHQIIDTLPWPAGLDREPCLVVDQVEQFGLHHLPEQAREITELRPGSAISGTLRCVIGRELVLHDAEHGALLLDARLLAGWPPRFPPTADRVGASSGVELSLSREVSGDDDAHQPSLF
jgi:hypothetical protein